MIAASGPGPAPGPAPERGPAPAVPGAQTRTIWLVGNIPPEVWNRLGTKILPKLRSGSDLKVGVDFSVTVNNDIAGSLASDLRQILDDFDLADRVEIRDSS